MGKGDTTAVEYHSHDFNFEWWKQQVISQGLCPSDVQPHPSVEEASCDDVEYCQETQQSAWEQFHQQHEKGVFFKERRYLLVEFPELSNKDDPYVVLEIGCGNGSSALPLLREQGMADSAKERIRFPDGFFSLADEVLSKQEYDEVKRQRDAHRKEQEKVEQEREKQTALVEKQASKRKEVEMRETEKAAKQQEAEATKAAKQQEVEAAKAAKAAKYQEIEAAKAAKQQEAEAAKAAKVAKQQE
eukprot:gene3956-4925_t